ncbi:PH domain-containing protein [Nakamurella flavida]|uniref:PH domain-containing protein n=1 Tax=Nakamurella flavida TaxID=363630 RepID=A0A939C6C6_9ACTN|nr:PH domain-containing protein [Nakamurella flavida]MBM9477062.1 PH domain-containing protein [Nakamurella flavida]MDP9780008.1 putative membrane protein [Nakamurella flavida]
MTPDLTPVPDRVRTTEPPVTDPTGSPATDPTALRKRPADPAAATTVEAAGPAADTAGPVIAERRLHPAYLLISGGRMARGLIPLVAVGVWRLPGWTFAVCGVIVAAYAVSAWASRRYSVTHGVLTVRSGILRRSEHTIPASRITSLDARQGLVQRVLRVWALRVVTPSASEHPAMELACLSAPRLAELRAALTPSGSPSPGPTPPRGTPHPAADASPPAAPAGDAAAPPVAPSGEVVAVLGRRELVVATLTGVSAPLIFAGGAAAYGRFRELVPRDTFRDWERRVLGGGSATVLVLVGLAVLAVVIGSLLTAQRMARFTLVRDGDRLRTSRGLISQRVDTVVLDRVQAVRIVQGVLRRALGYCALEVEVAGHGRNDAQDRTLFPLVRLERAEALVQTALPELRWRPGPLTPVPGRSRRRYLTAPVVVGAVLTAAALLLPGWWAGLAVVPLPVAVAVGTVQGRVAGWRLDGDTVTLRSHALISRSTTVARVGRVQLTRVSSTVFQRRAALASVHLTLSSRRRISARHLDRADADLLLHRVGRRRPSNAAGSGPYRG